MWTTTLSHPSAFVKLSVTMASLPHRNFPSDSQVYTAMGSGMLRSGNRKAKKGVTMVMREERWRELKAQGKR